jgi:hypothetical protein
MRKFLSSFLLLLVSCAAMQAQQQTTKKYYPAGTSIGDATLAEEWTESDGRQSAAVYVVDINTPGNYFVRSITNMQKGARQSVTADGRTTSLILTAAVNGWQQSTTGISGSEQTVSLIAGRHTLRFTVTGNMPPLNDGISLSRSNTHPKLDADWQSFSANLNRLMADQPVSTTALDKSNPVIMENVLPNPEGNYEHAIDTAFAYSTFQWVTLTGGNTYTFTTNNSTKDPVLHLFDPNNLATSSWYNDDGGVGYESILTVTIPATATYALLVRPYFGGQSGITTIKQNGVDILINTPIAGQRFTTTARTGDLNYFTCKLGGGAAPDTRLFTLNFAGGAVTGYNDDYHNGNGGTWNWGLSSRVKKNYASGSTIVFVCAYSAAKTGVCDVYMGNGNGQLPISEPANFPLLKPEDAIQSAPSTGTYNCISWTGGITSSWSWPPSSFSPWYVANNELAGFDKFYSNTPLRFPGAANYTRSGATSANAKVDLWKKGSYYQHASVTKPGNDHPHGYDWESKPGSLDRTFHPRNALTNANWYGVVTDYYKPTGTFAKNIAGKSFATDADAVAAGVAVYENAQLSAKAQDKLSNLLAQADRDVTNNFDQLYEKWKQTWAANASLSDPDAYCNNTEFEKLQAYCNKNTNTTMLLVFEKFVGGDHLTSKLVWELTRSRYASLLDEAKQDILNNPYDERGRFKINGDHDNGIRYIEKILQQLEIKPVEPVPAVSFTVTASPNPVKDVLTVTVEVKEKSRISVNAVSAQTGINRLLQNETTVTPGTYQYRLNKSGFAGSAGDIIIVQVKVNDVLQIVKVLVGN